MRYRLKLMRWGSALAAVFMALLPYLLLGQSRFEDGEFKGFISSPTEHIINRYEEVVTARDFEGSVVYSDGAPLPGAIVEVRGPDSSERIKGTIVDRQGQFRIGHLKKGTYAFKVTLNTFQSVVGQLIIKSGEERKTSVRIVLQVGV